MHRKDDGFGNMPLMYGTPETMFHTIPQAEEIVSPGEYAYFTNGKEFNLEKALAGDPIQTTSNKPARIICTDRKDIGDSGLVVLVMEDNCNREIPYCFTNEGKQMKIDRETFYDYQLEMAPKKVTKWFCLYHYYSKFGSDTYDVQHRGPFDTKEEAEAYGIKSINYVKKAVYPVEYEE